MNGEQVKSQIRAAKPGEDQCDRCTNVANVFHDNGQKLCLTHASLDKQTFTALLALRKAGLIT